MKKVLALVLAVMMLATTAFAVVENPTSDATNGFKTWLPGKTISVNDSGIAQKDGKDENGKDVDYILATDPAAKNVNAPTTSDGKVIVKSINTDNYTITGIKYNDGKKLVAGIEINNAKERVDIKLLPNYGKTTSSNLDVEFTLKGKKVGKTFKPENIVVRMKGTVGYKLDTASLKINTSGDVRAVAPVDVGGKELMDSGKLSDIFAASEKVLWEVDKVDGGENYGDLDYTTADPDVDVTVRVYDGDKLYLYSNVDPVTDVLKKFADEDAEISFLNHPNTEFNSTATVRCYKEEGETYFYEWVDGVLIDMNGKAYDAGSAGIGKKVNWDEDEGCYVLKTRTMPGTLVMSDKPLPVGTVETTDPTPANPDTGANDVVGIATALAAVALVSAAAVSLKK